MSGEARAAGAFGLQPGEVFAGRYCVEECLGQGGMGAVYRVRDEQLEETVALKVIALGHVKPTDLERFKREVRLARRITHPNVARTYDIGEHGGTPFLTMEYIDGHSLEAIIHAPMDPAQAVGIALAIARGLEAAHAAGVVHRDLKPANVLVDQSGRVVLTDFGVARSVLDESQARASGVLGTPAYMSPEQAMGEALDHRSDVYSFGIVLYEMLTAQLPFDSDTAVATVLARCTVEPVDPRTYAPVPDELAELVLACLTKDRASRLASAGVAAQRLESWLAVSATAHSRTAIVVPHRAAPPVAAPRARTLAVLPFVVRGSHEYLGDSLAQELIDVLARSRGMRVLAFGATSGYREPGDPRRIGSELGVDSIVEGNAQAQDDRVRVSVRLHDVASGLQIWSERFDGRFADVFDMQTIMSQRIANALRSELSVVDSRGTVSGPALSLYLQGRRELGSSHYFRHTPVVELFERCLEASPNFKPAVAAHAMACMRAWWTSSMLPSERDWASDAKASVERALALAGDLAETHLAAAMYGLAVGDIARTVSELLVALEIAPALAEAHRYLGELQCEVGRIEEGVARLRLTLELDASRTATYLTLARVFALQGDYEAYEREMQIVERISGDDGLPGMVMRVRVASWRGDRETALAIADRAAKSELPSMAFVTSVTRFGLGEGSSDVLDAVQSWAAMFKNPRMSTLTGQLAVETLCIRREPDKAMEWLKRTCNDSLLDLLWLHRCPVLEPLRALPAFNDAVAIVQKRADAIRWLEIPRP